MNITRPEGQPSGSLPHEPSPSGGGMAWSEQYRIAGERWSDLEAAAQLLEDSKSAILAQWCAELGDLPVNRAEQVIKASPKWRQHIAIIVEARKEANKAKIQLEYTRMKFAEWNSAEANRRAEMKL